MEHMRQQLLRFLIFKGCSQLCCRRHTHSLTHSDRGSLLQHTNHSLTKPHKREIMDQWQQYVLKSKDKVVTITSESDSGNKLKLCIKDIQGGLRKAPIVWKRERTENDRNQVAMCYMYERHWYIAKVEGDNLQLERCATRLETISKSCWFQKENDGLGAYCCLKNVENPRLYLFISEQNLCAGEEKSTFKFVSVKKGHRRRT